MTYPSDIPSLPSVTNNLSYPKASDINTLSQNLAGVMNALDTNFGGASPAHGDILYRSASGEWTPLSAGTNGQILVTQGVGANPIWSTVSSDIIGQKRLTLTSNTPVTTSDVTAATDVYWTDGTDELSVSVPATTVTPFDVFYNPASSGSLETVNWTNDTTRATGLTRASGRLVKSGDTTKVYLGTARTTGVSGQTEDSKLKRFLWNYYNRKTRLLLLTEATASWTYNSTTIRAARGQSTNRVEVVIGVTEDVIDLSLLTSGIPAATNNYGYAGIGEDTTTAFTADGKFMGGGGGVANLPWFVFSAYLQKYPAVGYHYYSWNERADANGNFTFYGVGSVSLGSGLTGYVIG